jgi:transposase-like protein
MKYLKERKKAIIKKMMPPNNKSILQLSREEGICSATLYKWRQEARQKGQLLPDSQANPMGWASSDKFAAVIETASFNEIELSDYCRKRGLYPEQIREWRAACEQANDWDQAQNKALKEARKEDSQLIKKLEIDLRRKEKALAETAALLVLTKKAQAIWGETEDE